MRHFEIELDDLIRSGWVSRRIPPMSSQAWADMLSAIGLEHYLVAAEIVREDGKKRGRLLLSPQGCARFDAWQILSPVR